MKKKCSRSLICLFSVILVIMMFQTQALAGNKKSRVKSIKVTSTPANILVVKKNQKYKLKIKVSTTGKISKKVTYKSANPKIATVSSNGKVKGIRKGTTKITVRSVANPKVKKTIKVKVGTPVKKIILQNKKVTMEKGTSYKIKAKFSPKKPTYKKLSYKCSDKTVAKVSKSGKVTALKPGNASITIKSMDGSNKKATCVITVLEDKSSSVSNNTSVSQNTVNPQASESPVASAEPTASEMPEASKKPEASADPSQAPTVAPSMKPSQAPSATPTVEPSVQPSAGSSQTPMLEPSVQPSAGPSQVPTAEPSVQPSVEPSAEPGSTGLDLDLLFHQTPYVSTYYFNPKPLVNGQLSESEAGAGAEAEQETTTDQMKQAYLDFLDGTVKMVNKAPDLSWIKSDQECTYEEMNAAFQAELEADFMEAHLTSAEYAFIDCGADGVPELALHQAFTFEVDAANQYSVFKYIDGQVCLVSSQYGYYRSFVNMNEYGYITHGGSAGASVYYQDVKFVNKDGEEVFLHSESDEMGLADAYVPTYSFPTHEAPDGYPEDIYAYSDDAVTCVSYSLESYVYDEQKGDEEYYRNMFHSFYDIEGSYVAPDEELAKLYQENGITFYELSEAEKKIKEHEAALGVTDQIREGGEIEFISLFSDEQASASDQEGESDYADEENILYVTNPSDEYYKNENAELTKHGTAKPVTLKQKSCTENQVTDYYEWFQKVGMQWDVDPFHTGAYTYHDDNYLYEFTGIEEYGRTTQLAVYEYGSGNYIKTFDFHDFVWADGYEGADFVDRRIIHALIQDDVLYINLYHRTYAETCPMNAYLMAIDFNSGEVIWKSKPLVSNSDNFVLIGDAIVTGYGFTAEDHYLSIIDRFTGEEIGHEKVKKSPDYFYYKDQVLYVRTYSYDYEFDVKIAD